MGVIGNSVTAGSLRGQTCGLSPIGGHARGMSKLVALSAPWPGFFQRLFA